MLKKVCQYLLGFTLFIPLVLDLHFYQPYTSIKYFYFLLLILLLLPGLLFYWQQKKDLWQHALVKAVVLFFILLFVLAFFSVDFGRSFFGDWQRFDGLIYFVFYLPFFLALVIFLDSKEIWLKFLRTHALVLSVSLLWAYGQYFSWSVFSDEQATRVFALIGNANFLAHYLVLSFFLVLFLAFFDKKFQKIYLALAFLILPVVLFTQSRGAFLSLAITLVLLTIFYIAKIWSKSRQTALVISLVFLFGILLASQLLSQRFTSYSFRDTTIETRLVAWQAAGQGFREKPIFGWGKNNFQLVFNKYLDLKIYKGEGTPMWFDKAHNQYFDFLVEMGLVGLLAYLVFLFFPFIYFKVIKQRYGNKIALALFAGLLANFIFLFFNFDTIASYPLYFIYLALIYFLSSKVKQTENAELKNFKIFFIFGLIVSCLLVYYIFWPQLKANVILKQIYVSHDKQLTLAAWSAKAEQVYNLAPNYSTDLILTMAESLTQQPWPLEEQIMALRTLLFYSQTNSQKHLLDAKMHYLTANSALRLGALNYDEYYLLQAVDYYTNILPILTPGSRPDLSYNLASAYYQLSLLHPEQKEDLKQKALLVLAQNLGQFPELAEVQAKYNFLEQLFAQ